ncbi:MAG: ArsR/SmtB family transcription factor [Candidatus Thorarchaeota archaeon]
MTSRGKKSAEKAGVTCDFDCAEYSPERMEVLQKNRSMLGESDFNIFTSGIRLGIALMLMTMESACVCEIQYALNESRQPLISHHLRTMKKAGWLRREKWKRWTFYSLVTEKKAEMMSLVKGYCQWSDSVDKR